MSEIESGRWRLEDAGAAEVLARLPEFEKVMVVMRNGGATHERIGPVEEVSRRPDGKVSLGHRVHTAEIDPEQVAAIILDTTSQMRGKVFPALEFADAQGETLFSVIGMDAPEGFVAAFEGTAKAEAAGKRREMPSASDAPDDISDDPGFAMLDGLRAVKREVMIQLELGGRAQSWSGEIEEVRPAMGFANVMTGDFHLHLKAGAVAEWHSESGRHVALDADGAEIGLSIETPKRSTT